VEYRGDHRKSADYQTNGTAIYLLYINNRLRVRGMIVVSEASAPAYVRSRLNALSGDGQPVPRVVAVPKAEIDRREKEWKRAKKRKRLKKG
jgi:hypothetical protein